MTVAPEGRKLLRVEARNSETPIEKKPRWIRNSVKTGPEYEDMKQKVKGAGLHTVCQEAGCPNIHECWESREATFLIGGSRCSRRCDFCDIASGRPDPLDRDEPRRVAEEVKSLNLNYSTITGVTRDDLDDEGAWLYAEVVRKIHELNPHTGVENLTPDFSGKPDLLQEVFEARPEVFAHNVETVPRIFRRIRPAFRYERSLDVIRQARDFGLITKSNLILGMGETPRGSSRGPARPGGRRLRHHHDHPVPAPRPDLPPDRPLGEAGRVHRVPRRRLRDGLRRRHVRPAGALLLPRGQAVR